jgi:peptidoglycan/LPS O-acetylase OafA/YrhL
MGDPSPLLVTEDLPSPATDRVSVVSDGASVVSDRGSDIIRASGVRPSSGAKRLDTIDGLRALAALWVVLHHAIITSEPTHAMASPLLRPILSSLFFGQFPVMVFLLLSGFCLYYPQVNKYPRPVFTMGYLPYLKRRWRRIAPPYYWAGAFCLVMQLFPALRVGDWRSAGPVDAGVIASHLAFVHNLIPSHSAKIDYPMWSIGLEWQLYLLFPLMMGAFRRWNGVVVTGAALVVAAVVRASYHHLPAAIGPVFRDGPLAYIEIFSAGMLAAAMTAPKKTLGPNWFMGLIAIGGFAVVRLGNGNGLLHDLGATAMAFSLLLLAADKSTIVSRALSAPWLVRIGVFSYSVYLVHAPLLFLSWFALRLLHLSSDLTFAILVFVCLPGIVAACYGFHCLFERPFMTVPKAAKPAGTEDATGALATVAVKIP